MYSSCGLRNLYVVFWVFFFFKIYCMLHLKAFILAKNKLFLKNILETFGGQAPSLTTRTLETPTTFSLNHSVYNKIFCDSSKLYLSNEPSTTVYDVKMNFWRFQTMRIFCDWIQVFGT